MKKAVLLASSTRSRQELAQALKEKSIELDYSDSRNPFANLDPATIYDLVFFEANDLENDIRLVEQIRRRFPTAPAMVLCTEPQIRQAVEFIRQGIDDYISLPIKPAEVDLIVDRTFERLRQKAEVEHLNQNIWQVNTHGFLTSKSRRMNEVLDQVKSVTDTRSTVLLLGETGVGKSMIAKLIHDHSHRKSNSFVAVHCGAIPDNLVESELFGHEKGAFTDAVKRKLGKFEIADQGTVFLDEIGTITPATQVKLLQVLQDSRFTRVGGEAEVKVDVRVIAATNDDLKVLVEEKKFRNDLYYRLNVFPITVPSLRERKEDIYLLARHFIEKFSQTFGKNIDKIDDQAVDILESYSWPGNVRELENVIERAFILEKSTAITPESLPLQMQRKHENTAIVPMNSDLTLAEVRENSLASIERQYLKDLLAKTKGRVGEAAKISGVGLRQFHKLLNKYEIRSKEFKTASPPIQ